MPEGGEQVKLLIKKMRGVTVIDGTFKTSLFKKVFFRIIIGCQEIARIQDFKPLAPELLVVFSALQTPNRKSTSLWEVPRLVIHFSIFFPLLFKFFKITNVNGTWLS